MNTFTKFAVVIGSLFCFGLGSQILAQPKFPKPSRENYIGSPSDFQRKYGETE